MISDTSRCRSASIHIKELIDNPEFYKNSMEIILNTVRMSEVCDFSSLINLVKGVSKEHPDKAPLILNVIKFNDDDITKSNKIISCLENSPFCKHIGEILKKDDDIPEINYNRIESEIRKLKTDMKKEIDTYTDDLFKAVKNQNIHNLIYLIEDKHMDPTIVVNDKTLLHCAAKNGCIDIINYLSDKVDINAKNSHGQTALHIAASEGHLNAINQLIKCGADKDAKDNKGRTPILEAVIEGRKNVIKFLTENKIGNIRDKDKYQQTALHISLIKNQISTFKVLVEDYKLDINQTDDMGNTPLSNALEIFTKFIEYIMDKDGYVGKFKDRRIQMLQQCIEKLQESA